MKSTLDGEFTIDLGCRIDTGAVDIVFCIDSTGSMSGTISNVRSNIDAFASELDARGYDYRFGGVTFGDGTNIWDFDAGTPGYQMTDDYWTFRTNLFGVGAWGGDDWAETSWDAIWDAMEYYDWRPDALHIIIMFTDAPSCALDHLDGSGCCCNSRTDVYSNNSTHPYPGWNNPYGRAVAQGFVVFVSSPTSTISWWDNLYRDIAYDTGGNWYELYSTSWSTIFDDVVALIDTFEIINFCVTNNSGATIDPGIATVYPGACISILSANPQSYGPWAPGEEHCFVWRMSSVEGCIGPDACFTVTISGGGYADTTAGCVFLEDCACPGPEATPLCPPCPGGGEVVYTACPEQPITIQLVDEDSWVNTSTITLVVNGTPYNFPDHMSWADPVLTWTPSSPWAHGQTVNYQLQGAEDGNGCPLISNVDCNFIVDLLPPDVSSFTPPCGTELEDTMLSVSVTVSDDVAGIDILSAYFTVNGTPYYVGGGHVTYLGDYTSGTLTLSGSLGELGVADAGSVVVCVYVADRVPSTYAGCDLCGPNDTTACCTYILNNPPVAWFVSPDSASIVACDPAEILIAFSDPDGDPIDSMSLQLEVWTSFYPTHTTYTITSPWFNMVDETTAILSPDVGYFASGDTVWAQLVAGADIFGNDIENLPLGWMFVVDYDPPVYFDEFPPPESILYEFPETAHVVIFDSVAGLDPASVQVTVNGYSWSDWSVAMSSDGSFSLTIELTDSLCLAVGETCAVEVCVQSADLPDTCGPNDTTYCWRFYWVHEEPWAEILFPTPASVVACEDSTVELVLHGGAGPVDSTSIVLVIDNGDGTPDTFTIYHPWLYIDYGGGDTVLVLAPPLGYWLDSDTIVVTLVWMTDIYGTPASDLPLTWTFYTDFSPPVTWGHFPPDSATIAVPAPTIAFEITDSVAGLDPLSFFVVVTDTCGTLWSVDTFRIGDPEVVWDYLTHFEILPTGYEFEDGDTVWVCVVSMVDTPTYCGPNDTTNCWWFMVSLSGPVGEIISYEPGAYVACDSVEQRIELTVTDPDGVIPDSIVLVVEGDTLRYPDFAGSAMYYEDDTLVFIPLEAGHAWHDAEVVDVCLWDAVDSLGNHMAHPLCWSFTMDLSPPSLWGAMPPPDTVLNDSTARILIHVWDSLSGINDSTLLLIVNGDTLRIGDEGVHWDPGDSLLEFDIADLGTSWSDYDTVEVCVYAEDSPDYCPPNDTLYCWRFFVRLSGPVATIITPLPEQITACEDQCILLTVVDDDTLVDTTSIRLYVACSHFADTFDLSDPRLSWHPDTLRFCPDPASFWVNNETVYVSLISADDVLGNPLSNPLSWEFYVDLEPPLVSGFEPACGETVRTSMPTLSLVLTDNLAGVDDSATVLVVDDSVTIHLYDGSVSEAGTLLSLNSALAGLRWSGGDSIKLCVEAYDSPDLCPPNDSVYCCRWFVAPGGPYPVVLRPFDGAWSSCEDEHIVFTLQDDDGVVDTSISFFVIRSSDPADTAVLGAYSPGVVLSGDSTYYTVEYHPSPPFADGETVWVCVTSATDYLDNPMSPSPLCWSFYMDLSAPYVWGGSPGAGEVVPEHEPTVCFHIADDGSGVDLASLVFSVNGTPYAPILVDSSALLFCWYAESSGVSFDGGDVVTISISATDTTDYCADNVLDTSWTFVIEPGGPVAEALRPFGYSSCLNEYIQIWLFDSSGIDTTSIVLVVGGDTISWGDPQLSFDPLNWMLYFVPSPPWPDSAHISASLIACSDIYGNPLESMVDWDFYIDRIPPVVWGLDPAPGATVADVAPTISMFIADSIAGLALDSILLLVDGAAFTLTSPGISFDTTTGYLAFDPSAAGLYWAGGSTVSVCLSAFDLADDYYGVGDWYGEDCPPNQLDTCWSFVIMLTEPYAVIPYPGMWDYVACDPDSVPIVVINPETTGLIADSIRIVVSRFGGASVETLRVGDSTATQIAHVITLHDTVSFYFVPDPPFADAETVTISVISACDSLFNPMTTTTSVTFIVDLTPPVVLTASPGAGDVVDLTSPEICVEIYDSLSGISDSSVALEVDGVLYNSDSAGFTWDGERVCLDASLAGLSWSGGDTVLVCVRAGDSPDWCGPNELDSCWYFVISPGEPYAEVLHPGSLVVSACPGESVVIMLYDPEGDNIIDTSIVLTVESNYRVDTLRVGASLELDWREPESVLVYYPSPAFFDGESVLVCVISAEDTLHNELSSPVCVEFSLDLSAYVAWGFEPGPWDTVSERSPDIVIHLIDSLTGIAESSLVLTVDGVAYTLDSSALYWADDTTLVFVPESAGVYWSGGDCILVELYAYDQPTPGYCSPNDSTISYEFCISPGGPVGEVIRPFDGAYSSCVDEHIELLMTDEDGVDSSTIALEVNGVIYTLSDSELSWSGETLYFHPSPPFVDGEVVYVCLVSAYDLLGNPLEDTICWSFVMDLSSPWAELVEPSVGMVRDRSQDIVLRVGDDISGVDSMSLVLTVNGVDYRYGDFVWTSDSSFGGGFIRFIPEAYELVFPPGETVYVEIYLTDSTDYCADNYFDTLFAFMIEPEVACLVHPNPFTPNGDGVNEYVVFDYPYMYSEGAELRIYDLRNVLVYHRRLDAIGDVGDFLSRSWSGVDDSGRKLPEGLYIWLIIRDGEVICNGTVTLVR